MEAEVIGPEPGTTDNRVAKDLLSGTVGGIAQVLVGQPFDIVKVRLQSSDAYSGTLDCVTKTARNEGPLAFYKGTTMPLFGIGVCVSLQFAFVEAIKRNFQAANLKRDQKELSLGQLYLSGAGAGVGNSIASGPVEHVRIRLQTQPANARLYNGPLDVIKKLHATDGLRGIYYGQMATILREFHGYGLYFLYYESQIQRICKTREVKRTEIPAHLLLGHGATAGIVMWLGGYPLDVIKSKIQTDKLPSDPNRQYNGIIDCVKKTMRTQGINGFFKGIIPTLIRAPFANAATFFFFEATSRMLN